MTFYIIFKYKELDCMNALSMFVIVFLRQRNWGREKIGKGEKRQHELVTVIPYSLFIWLSESLGSAASSFLLYRIKIQSGHRGP